MTPGCTTEACDFRDSLAPLQAAGYVVLGVSRDDPEKLRRFRERDGLTYDLLSDPDHRVHLEYGVWGDKLNYGKVVEGVIRSTFVIDAEGRIEHALYNVRATGHVRSRAHAPAASAEPVQSAVRARRSSASRAARRAPTISRTSATTAGAARTPGRSVGSA